MPDENKTRESLLSRTDEVNEIEEPVIEIEDNSNVDEGFQERLLLNPLIARIHANLTEAESARQAAESQWIKNLQAYKGIDTHGGKNDNEVFRASENIKPYIRTTTVKTRAAYSHIMETLLQNSRFPLMIEPTPLPSGVPEYVTNDPNVLQGETQEDFGIGFEGDGKTLAPGATSDNLAWQEDEPLYKGLQKGRDQSGGQFAQISPAKRAAERVNKIIQDQLEESNAHKELRKAVFEACLLGTGIMKGVFTEEKVEHRWVDGEYSPVSRLYPKLHNISVWDLYIDPNALIFDDAEWVIERHRLSAKKMRDLKSRAYFDKSAIDAAIAAGPNYEDKSFEHIVRHSDKQMNNSRLWEVLEYWGYLSKEEAIGLGLDDAFDAQDDQIQVNIWLCGDKILRVMVNPFLPQRLPYFLTSYEHSPYSVYGVGVPETMEDSQRMMNGFARLAISNLALAGNVVFDIDETALVPGQSMDIFPGKIFRRQGGQAGQAVHAIQFPNTAGANLQMFQEFRRQADESTGIPSVSHGQTGVSGIGRTSSGLSMILENASLNIKTVIRNIDEDLLQPIGTMLFHWNNQFNSEEMPNGDLTVIPTGIRSYTKNEIKVQRLQALLQLTANPALAPMVKLPYIIREYVKGLDLDPNEVINDMDEAKVYAEIIGMAGGVQQGNQELPTDPSQAQGLTGAQGNTEGAGNPEGNNGQPTTEQMMSMMKTDGAQ